MKYPIGIQSFDRVIEDGYVYVDKTDLIYSLVHESSIYFLSRPRRFGKSLLVSTLKNYFLGRRELFRGLAIDELETEWATYPVFHVDFNGGNFTDSGELEKKINFHVSEWEKQYGIPDREEELGYGYRFIEVLRAAHKQTGRRCVVLIDEYDKPILDVLDVDRELEDRHRNVLKGFYSVFKGADEHLQFVLLTGVTKFSQVSVFSGFNQPKDISMDGRYETLCGITQEEIDRYFPQPIADMAVDYRCTPEEMKQRLKQQYDGYHFSDRMTDVYNPFSLLNTFKYMRLSDYWFETGTPTYLVELLKRTNYDLYDMANTETDADVLNSIDSASNNPIPVIYQSGYLTIKDYEPEFKIYRLGFPNQEVEEGFMKYLLPFYTNIQASKSPFEIGRFVREVRAGDYDAFFHRLQSFFADTSYEAIIGRNPERDTELHYRNVLFIVFKLVGFYTQAEYHTSEGRIDLVVKTTDYIYVMEFKLNGTAEEALRQIEERQYALPFASDPRQVFKIGVNFSSVTRNIERWLVE